MVLPLAAMALAAVLSVSGPTAAAKDGPPMASTQLNPLEGPTQWGLPFVTMGEMCRRRAVDVRVDRRTWFIWTVETWVTGKKTTRSSRLVELGPNRYEWAECIRIRALNAWAYEHRSVLRPWLRPGPVELASHAIPNHNGNGGPRRYWVRSRLDPVLR